MQNLTLALKSSKVTSWQFVMNSLIIITYTVNTDGSRMNNSVAAAAVSHEEVKRLRIPDKASIFTAELVALNLALDIVWHSSHKKFVIFSDSLSCLLAIQNLQLNLDML